MINEQQIKSLDTIMESINSIGHEESCERITKVLELTESRNVYHIIAEYTKNVSKLNSTNDLMLLQGMETVYTLSEGNSIREKALLYNLLFTIYYNIPQEVIRAIIHLEGMTTFTYGIRYNVGTDLFAKWYIEQYEEYKKNQNTARKVIDTIKESTKELMKSLIDSIDENSIKDMLKQFETITNSIKKE